jgi:hypothetical protein
MERWCNWVATKIVNLEVVVTEAPVGKAARVLEAKKVAEAAVESMMQSWASVTSHASLGKVMITASWFEYEYLTGRVALVAGACSDREDGSSGVGGVTGTGGLCNCELAAKRVTSEAGTAEEAEWAEEEWRAGEQELYDISATA